MLVAAGLYHWVFLKGAREGWPVVGTLVKLVVKDEFAQRDRFMRENLDAMARSWARCRPSWSSWSPWASASRAWPASIRRTSEAKPGQGGPLVSGRPLTMEELQTTLADLDRLTEQRTDLMTVVESRLFDQRSAA